jgi:integrase/recombinase XerD
MNEWRTKAEREEFRAYRLNKGYSPKTLKSQDCYVRRFTAWLSQAGLATETIDYRVILSFVSDERKRGLSASHLKSLLNAVRVYLDYLAAKGILEENPARRVRLNDRRKKTFPPVLEEETLLAMYRSFTAGGCKVTRGETKWRRDIVALGLLIFQGLDSGDLERLTTRDIRLAEGTIYIPSSRSNQSRTLKLESVQIIPIHEYLTLYRPLLAKEKGEPDSDRLFVSHKVAEMVAGIMRKLKPAYPRLQSPRHIRQSVIMNWLRRYHIRQVQYMAGHRRVSSTERYKQEDLRDLSLQLSKYHPLK